MKTLQQIIQKQYQRGMTVEELSRLYDSDTSVIEGVVQGVERKPRHKRKSERLKAIEAEKRNNRKIAELKKKKQESELAKRIKKMYFVENKQKSDIARTLKLSVITVSRIAERNKIELSQKKRDEIQARRISKMLKRGANPNEIQKTLNIGGTVYNRLLNSLKDGRKETNHDD